MFSAKRPSTKGIFPPHNRPFSGWPVRKRRAAPPALVRFVTVLLAGLCCILHGQARAASRWATGATLQRQLGCPVDIVWAENPLRQALRRLSESQGVAVLLDRRVDPDQKLSMQLADVPLRTALQTIARDRGLGVAQLGGVVYFGPPSVAARLRTLAALREEEGRRLPAAAAEKFQHLCPMAWDDLATPRDLFAGLAAQNGLALAGLEQVPHDLWAAADLPALSLLDRLTLIAIQFDLTLELSADGRRVRLVPVPERVAVVRNYPGGADAEATARRFAALAPGAEIKVVADRVYVRGLVEDQERISQPRVANSPAKQPPAQEGFALKQFTLTVAKQPVGPLLQQLARQLKLKLAIDQQVLDRAGISLDQRISFSVKGVTVDELLQAAAKPAGLKVRRHGNTVEVVPAP